MNDVRQDWTGSDSAASGPGPRRWRLTSGYELRIVVAETLPWSLAVAAGDRRLRVVPPARLLADDPDVAEVAGRQRSVASRP